MCEEYHKNYKIRFDQELPDCEYKGNKSKIQKLLRKVQIDANGIATEIQFDNKKNDEEMNVSKVQKLLRKVQIDANGSETEFDIKKNDEEINASKQKIKTKSKDSTSLGSKLKNFFRRK